MIKRFGKNGMKGAHLGIIVYFLSHIAPFISQILSTLECLQKKLISTLSLFLRSILLYSNIISPGLTEFGPLLWQPKQTVSALSASACHLHLHRHIFVHFESLYRGLPHGQEVDWKSTSIKPKL